jgi:N-acetylglutamate synthase-like GNAT family acetyltransferase
LRSFAANSDLCRTSWHFGFETHRSPHKLSAMLSSNYSVRRATLDDIGQLVELWKLMRFPVDELGKRITDFQIVEAEDGKLLGAVGLHIAERQGRIHSEAFTDFAHADPLRPALWERLHSVAVNHGLLRFWTQEQAPFWTHCGLAKADDETMAKLPLLFRGSPLPWLTLKLKDDIGAVISADKEFALFMASEKERTERAFQHARILKIIATLIALALFALVITGAFLLLRKGPALMRH